MEKFYAVFNIATGTFVPSPAYGNSTLLGKSAAKNMATDYNAAMKPEYQTYTVVTVTFDPEV